MSFGVCYVLGGEFNFGHLKKIKLKNISEMQSRQSIIIAIMGSSAYGGEEVPHRDGRHRVGRHGDKKPCEFCSGPCERGRGNGVRRTSH